MSDPLDNEGVEVSQLLDGRLGRRLKMLLFILASYGVLVTEDEVKLICITVSIWMPRHDFSNTPLYPGK